MPEAFQRIGAGTCGTVFEQPGSPVVMKRERVHGYEGRGLENEYTMQVRVYDAFTEYSQNHELDIHVPRPERLIRKEEDKCAWWNEHAHLFPKEHQEPANLFQNERIPPLPETVRELLIDRFCPAQWQTAVRNNPGNKHCLVRPYLGRTKPPQRRSMFNAFSLRNFNLHVDQCDEVRVDPSCFVHAMADSLALMHYKVRANARDVEFVLGGAPPGLMRSSTGKYDLLQCRLYFWLLDFNQVLDIMMDQAGIDDAVQCFADNDPYFPRPGRGDGFLWELFKVRYLETSETIVEKEHQDLPMKFIEGVVFELERRDARAVAARAKTQGDFMQLKR